MSEEELRAVGDDYYLFLDDLSTNSRPIISNLTQLAQENVNAAHYITKAIEKRIEKAVPQQKLYAFYLLDSISKNAGSPYTLLFGQNLFQTFTQAYLLVDDLTRKKFIDLFKTWKSATNSSGLPLFPAEPIGRIEQFLIKASSIYQQSIRNSTPTPAPTPTPTLNNFNITNSTLAPIVDKLLDLTNQRLLANPQDATISQKLQVINSLKVAIQTENLPPPAIQQIKTYLDDMTRQEESYLRSLTPTPAPPQQVILPNLNAFLSKTEPEKAPANGSTNGNSNGNSNGTTNGNTNGPIAAINSGFLNNLLNLKTTVPTIPSSTPPPRKDLSSLLSKLQNKGLVKPASTTSTSLPSTDVLKSLLSAKPSITSTGPYKTPQDSESAALLVQFDINSKLLTIDSSKTFKFFFQTSQPNKCGTCGKRFDNSPKGLERRREHLDWHFRINKKLKEGSIVQSRSWYLDDESFVNFRDDEIFSNIQDSDIQTKEKVEVKKEKRYVVVPADSTDMRVVCGICKEVMNGEYDDDIGEWVFKDAIEAHGKIYHEVCFNETKKNDVLEKLVLKRDRDDGKKVDLGLLKSIIGNFKDQK